MRRGPPCARLNLTPNEARKHGIAIRLDGVRRTALDLLSLPEVEFDTLKAIWPELGGIGAGAIEQLEVDAQYAGYLDRQDADILAFRRDEAMALPDDLDYGGVHGLSTEAAQKLEAIRSGDPGAGGADRRRHAGGADPGTGACPQPGGQRGERDERRGYGFNLRTRRVRAGRLCFT